MANERQLRTWQVDEEWKRRRMKLASVEVEDEAKKRVDLEILIDSQYCMVHYITYMIY